MSDKINKNANYYAKKKIIFYPFNFTSNMETITQLSQPNEQCFAYQIYSQYFNIKSVVQF